MAPITHFLNNRSPSLTDVITVNGSPFDLTASTVKLKMRLDTASTFKVNAAATITNAVAGAVQYDWAGGDVDTAGDYLFYWEITLPSGKTQDSPAYEFVIRDHATASSTLYVQVEDMKSTLALTGTTFAQEDIWSAIAAASRAIDDLTGRRYYLDVNASQVRYYTPDDPWRLEVDDIVAVTTLKTDDGGDGVFENTWTLNTDYVREPLNATANSEPFYVLRAHPNGSFRFPVRYPRSVELTGQFGWATPPAEVVHATSILAHRLLKRAREVPFGVAGIGLDGSTVRIMARDPDVMALINPLSRLSFVR